MASSRMYGSNDPGKTTPADQKEAEVADRKEKASSAGKGRNSPSGESE